MGYSVMFYTVDMAKLRQLYGSKDKTLFQSILAKNVEDIEGFDEEYADEIEDDGWATMKDTIKQIFAGKLKVAEGSEFRYGYALKMICKEIGQLVPLPGWGVSDVRRVPFATAMMKNGAPIPIPPESDFPEIGHLSADEVKSEHAGFASVPESTDEELNSEIIGFRAALQAADAVGVGLVSFRH